MDFIKKQEYIIKGAELEQKVNEIFKETPSINVCKPRFVKDFNNNLEYRLTIFRSNEYGTDILLIKENNIDTKE